MKRAVLVAMLALAVTGVAGCEDDEPVTRTVPLPNGESVVCVRADGYDRTGITCDWP